MSKSDNDDDAPAWVAPERPERLDAAFYQKPYTKEQLDDALWKYLCGLIAGDYRPFHDGIAEMLASIPVGLRRYYLVRSFDWERGSSGLEGCMMGEGDDLFVNETIVAYEALGAKDHARIIRELVPIAERRWVAIRDASAAGREFNYDDSPFETYEPQWDSACEQFDFYEVMFADMRKHPENYRHP